MATLETDFFRTSPNHKPHGQVPVEFRGDVGTVVDLFDAAVRVEARGYSDRSLSSRYGYASVFDLADHITGSGLRRLTARRTVVRSRAVALAWYRAGLLISGAVLAGFVQAQSGAGFTEMIVAGCAGWILGQAVAGAAWYRLGFGSREQAARYGGLMALVCAAVALAVASVLVLTGHLGLTGFFLVTGWGAYALSVSLLTVLNQVRLPLTVVLAAVLAQIALWLAVPVPSARIALLTVLPAVLAVAVIVVYTVRTVRAGEAAGGLDLAGFRGIVVPVLQSVLLAGALVIALYAVPDSKGTAFVATAVLVVACTDPGIVILRGRLSWFANRSSSLSWSRRFAWGLAALSMVVVAGLAAVLVLIIGTATSADHLMTSVLGSVLFTVLATLSSVLTAFGAQLKGLVPAALALVTMAAVASANGEVIAVVGTAAFAVSLSLLIHQFSDARVFA